MVSTAMLDKMRIYVILKNNKAPPCPLSEHYYYLKKY